MDCRPGRAFTRCQHAPVWRDRLEKTKLSSPLTVSISPLVTGVSFFCRKVNLLRVWQETQKAVSTASVSEHPIVLIQIYRYCSIPPVNGDIISGDEVGQKAMCATDSHGVGLDLSFNISSDCDQIKPSSFLYSCQAMEHIEHWL